MSPRASLQQSSSERRAPIWSFGDFAVDTLRYELRRSGALVRIEPRAFDVLRYLIEHRSRVVPAEELIAELWRGVSVSDGIVRGLICALRSGLGDCAEDPVYIETVRRRGYRFVHRVEVEEAPPLELGFAGASSDASRRPPPELDRSPPPAPGAWVAAPHARQPLANSPPGAQFVAGAIPPLPRLLVGRESDLEHLEQRLLGDASTLRSVTAVCGPPGVGKTALAAVLVRSENIWRRFSDGVLWCRVGHRPDARAALLAWAQAAKLDPAPADLDLTALSLLLAHALKDKRVLLVVDDLWAARDLEPLCVGSAESAMLVTTRLPDLADTIALARDIYRVDPLPDETTRELMRALAPECGLEDRDTWSCIAEVVEGIPMYAHAAGEMFRTLRRHGAAETELLDAHDLRRRLLRATPPADMPCRRDSIDAVLADSTDALSPATVSWLSRLSTPAATHEPRRGRGDARPPDDDGAIARALIDAGLIERTATGRYRAHSVIAAHARDRAAKTDSTPPLEVRNP